MTIRAEGVGIARSWLDAAFADAHQRAWAVPQDPSPSLPAASQRQIARIPLLRLTGTRRRSSCPSSPGASHE